MTASSLELFRFSLNRFKAPGSFLAYFGTENRFTPLPRKYCSEEFSMAAYIVLAPEGAGPSSEDCRFIRDGFSWVAALFPTYWAIWRGLYVDAVLLFAVRGLGWTLLALPGAASLGAGILLATSLIYGFEGNIRRSAYLEKKGWTNCAVLTARDLGEAEELHYHDFPADRVEQNGAPVSLDRQSTPSRRGGPHYNLGMISLERGRR
jgi:hypothetical protein